MKTNDAKQAFFNHIQGDVGHKIAFYANNFISKPGMEGFINGDLKDQFPEVHQAIQDATATHSKIMDQLNNQSDDSTTNKSSVTSPVSVAGIRG